MASPRVADCLGLGVRLGLGVDVRSGVLWGETESRSSLQGVPRQRRDGGDGIVDVDDNNLSLLKFMITTTSALLFRLALVFGTAPTCPTIKGTYIGWFSFNGSFVVHLLSFGTPMKQKCSRIHYQCASAMTRQSVGWR